MRALILLYIWFYFVVFFGFVYEGKGFRMDWNGFWLERAGWSREVVVSVVTVSIWGVILCLMDRVLRISRESSGSVYFCIEIEEAGDFKSKNFVFKKFR